MPLSRRKFRSLILLAALAIFVSAAVLPLSAQLQVAQLHGRVLDAQSAGVAHAAVVLQDPSGHAIRRSVTETDGAFRIADVAPGSYVIRVELGGTVMLTRPLVVRGSPPGGAHAPDRTRRRRVNRRARRRRLQYGGTSVDARRRRCTRGRRAASEPARTGGACQSAWLEGRGQRPSARAWRRRWTALRAGRYSGLCTIGSPVWYAPEPVRYCVAPCAQRVRAAGVRVQERRGRGSPDGNRHPQRVVGDDRHRLGGSCDTERRRIRLGTLEPWCGPDADRIG